MTRARRSDQKDSSRSTTKRARSSSAKAQRRSPERPSDRRIDQPVLAPGKEVHGTVVAHAHGVHVDRANNLLLIDLIAARLEQRSSQCQLADLQRIAAMMTRVSQRACSAEDQLGAIGKPYRKTH